MTGHRLPEGLKLALEAKPYSGNGKGRFGRPGAKIFLSQTPQALITNIGASYTGDGPFNGHNLAYTLELDDASKVASVRSMILEIVFTITE